MGIQHTDRLYLNNLKDELEEGIAMTFHKSSEGTDMIDLQLNEDIRMLCLSKMEEFHSLGYKNVEYEEIWACVSYKYKKTGVPLLHQIVSDILTLKITYLTSWLATEALKESVHKDAGEVFREL